jgi:uncharacterized heparinase superfamily protein
MSSDASDTISGGRPRLRRSWNDGLFYELQLNGPSPDRLLLSVDDPYKAQPDAVTSLIEDYADEAERISRVDSLRDGFITPWRQLDPSLASFTHMHRFAWLRDFHAHGEDGTEVARALVEGWLTEYGKYSQELWAPEIVVERLWHLAAYGKWLMSGMDAMWRSRLLTSMARQTRHLAKSVSRIERPFDKLKAALTLSLMGLALPYHETCAEQGTTLLRRELRLQLRADGGHISRNPSLQLILALRLQALLSAYRSLKVEAPNFLHHAVGRCTDMIEFFRVGDGRLVVFNGGMEDDPKALATALSYSSIGRNRIDFASQSGYQRLSSARTYLYVDTGGVRRLDNNRRVPERSKGYEALRASHDGLFALQFSTGRQRLIVNCGSVLALEQAKRDMPLAELKEWHTALSGPDAHSTLCVEGADTSGAMMPLHPVYHRLEEDRRGQLLELERKGVAGAPEATHRRRLYLSVDGDDLRGEDILIPASQEEEIDWLLRFHLYPGLRTSLSRDRQSVLLVTPQNEGWTFKTANADVKLESSIYCSVDGIQPTQQIVVRPDKMSGRIRQLKWSFRK